MNLNFNEDSTPRPHRTSQNKEGGVLGLIKKTGLATTDKQANTVALILIGILSIITLIALSSM